jgi:hypothetical protein
MGGEKKKQKRTRKEWKIDALQKRKNRAPVSQHCIISGSRGSFPKNATFGVVSLIS